jgi:hypothetical protein
MVDHTVDLMVLVDRAAQVDLVDITTDNHPNIMYAGCLSRRFMPRGRGSGYIISC